SGRLVVEVRIPRGLQSLTARVTGTVQNNAENRRSAIEGGAGLLAGELESTTIERLLLVPSRSGYRLELRGRNGEPIPDRPVDVSLRHAWLSESRTVHLRTDDRGRIELGGLDRVARVSAWCARDREFEPTRREWSLPGSNTAQPAVLHVETGAAFTLPGGNAHGETHALLVELRGVGDAAVPYADRTPAIRADDTRLEVAGLPAGDYHLYPGETSSPRLIRVGHVRADDSRVAATGHRVLAKSPPLPARVAAIDLENDALVIALEGASDETTVRVEAHRALTRPVGPSRLRPRTLPVHWRRSSEASFLVGRELDDEYRYILDRRDHPHYAGNPLERPGLILNPWAVRSTEAVNRPRGPAADSRDRRSGADPGTGESPDFFGLEFSGPSPALLTPFLERAPLLLLGLRPGTDGTIRIPREQLTGYTWVTVCVESPGVVGPNGSSIRTLLLDDTPLEVRDLTLGRALDVDRHFVRRRRIVTVEAGGALTVDDARANRVQWIASLSDLFRVAETMVDAQLGRFAPLLDWPTATDAEKEALYTELAGHELHYFLHQKDRDYFDRVVVPHLRNKHQPTFLDRYLLGEDLSGDLELERYIELNPFERALLCERYAERSDAIQRELRDTAAGTVLALEDWNRGFERALELRALDRGGLDESAKGAPERRREDDPPAKEAEERDRAFRDRARVQSFVDPSTPTLEFAERNYLGAVDAGSGAALDPDPFWVALADHFVHATSTPFLTEHLLSPIRSVTAAVLAIASLDLPFVAEPPTVTNGAARRVYTSATPWIAFVEELQPTTETGESTVRIGERFVRPDRRTVWIDGVERESFVNDAFQIATPYVLQVTLSNPSALGVECDLLTQVPAGAVPLDDVEALRNTHVELEAFGSKVVERLFYFPRSGGFDHHGSEISADGAVLASVPPTRCRVVEQLDPVGAPTWSELARSADEKTILEALRTANPTRLDLSELGWRIRDRDGYVRFGRPLLDLLRSRRHFVPELWCYGLLHEDERATREYLASQHELLVLCGGGIDTPLISTVDREIVHLDYRPLVHSRAHPFGGARSMDNVEFEAHYRRFLEQCALKPSLDDRDRLALTEYLALQDRTGEALEQFARVDRTRLRSRLQYDYLEAYLALSTDDRSVARARADEYRDHPIAAWRKRFAEIDRYLDEAEGRVEPAEGRDEGPRDERLAALEPVLELSVGDDDVRIDHRNLVECRIAYYPMDVEFLFSSQPFVSEAAAGEVDQWTAIRPVRVDRLELPRGEGTTRFQIPEAFRRRNFVIEVSSAGKRRAVPCYSSAMQIDWLERTGRLEVHDRDGRPLPRTYIKVYSRDHRGGVLFHKDGYTDLRGRFDYVTTSVGLSVGVTRLAILVLSDENGALIREVDPPL
ncbi:MAG: hypothetical protein KDC38_09490, partial [Planctomycetes bacterium]|nr:hypothetical protein [Planctomycetota bacterium]